jgi:hypothetical protein
MNMRCLQPDQITVRCLSLAALAVFSHSAIGQTTSPGPYVQSPTIEASAADSKLRQMDLIYQQQLRARHIPVLGRYLTELQKLAASAADPTIYDSEIKRVQTIISAGGVVDLNATANALNPAAKSTGEPPAASALTRSTKAVTTLTPAFARNIQPMPEGSASPEAAAIGQIEWRIDMLPAGTYELVIQYACPTAKPDLMVEAAFAGQKISKTLDASKLTKDNTSYRLLRLGRMTLAKAVSGETLRLTSGSADSSAFLVRNFVISRSDAKE